MRRALVGITPDELLNRKRKAFVSRARLVAIAADWPRYAAMTQNMAMSSLGIIEARRFLEVLQKARRGEEVPTVMLMRTVIFEGWLRNLHRLGLANLPGTWNPALA
jgi:asparagine synthase (glutamine-hydrolysing)